MKRLPAHKRREQLIEVATKLFAREGYAGTTTSKLADEAGVTEPIIYRHFSSKGMLFAAIIERTGERTIAQWEKDLADTDDPSERLRVLLNDNPMVTAEGQMAYRVFLQAITEIDTERQRREEREAIRLAVHEHMRKLHLFVASEVKRAQDSRKVTGRFSAEIIAWLLIEIGLGYGIMSAMHIPDHGKDIRGQHVLDLLSRILVGREAKSD